MEHSAIAENGPVSGDQSLTVPDHDADGNWQQEVVWTSGPDERHLYAFAHVGLTPTGVPVYKFVRTLAPDETDP